MIRRRARRIGRVLGPPQTSDFPVTDSDKMQAVRVNSTLDVHQSDAGESIHPDCSAVLFKPC